MLVTYIPNICEQQEHIASNKAISQTLQRKRKKINYDHMTGQSYMLNQSDD